MSLFAAIAVVCFMTPADNVQCDDYFLDQPQETWSDAEIISDNNRRSFSQAYDSGDVKDLEKWLQNQNIPYGLDIIVDVDIQTQEVHEDNLP